MHLTRLVTAVAAATVLAAPGCSSSSGPPMDGSAETGPVALGSGMDTTCAVMGTGQVKCWGRSGYAQFGLDPGAAGSAISGSEDVVADPVLLASLGGAVAVAVGRDHLCARRSGGAVVCQGSNNVWQLGSSAVGASRDPVTVTSVAGATHVTAGESHSCATLAGGGVGCWGLNWWGQLGNAGVPWGGLGDASAVPVLATGVAGATSIAAGRHHSCAVAAGGAVWCWGMNDSRQLGDGTNQTHPEPILVTSAANATAVGAGMVSTCARVADGRVLCWGSPYAIVPSARPALTDATAIAVGGFHACALVSGGQIKCWGRNLMGQLGNGTFTSSPNDPVLVSSIAGATAIAAGRYHTCAIVAGKVKCWGDNTFGTLAADPQVLTSSAVPRDVDL